MRNIFYRNNNNFVFIVAIFLVLLKCLTWIIIRNNHIILWQKILLKPFYFHTLFFILSYNNLQCTLNFWNIWTSYLIFYPSFIPKFKKWILYFSTNNMDQIENIFPAQINNYYYCPHHNIKLFPKRNEMVLLIYYNDLIFPFLSIITSFLTSPLVSFVSFLRLPQGKPFFLPLYKGW